MATPILLPRQGQSVESCIITKWHKHVGEEIKTGEVLFSYETDKAAFDEESPVDGVLLVTFFGEGDDVPVLLNVAVIGAPGESFEEFRPAEAGGATANEEASIPEAPISQHASAAVPIAAPTSTVPTATGTAFASPRARTTAQRMHVDLQNATPTGPNGRIIERDVLAIDRFVPATARLTTALSMAAENLQPAHEDVPLSGVRKAIARNMHSSLQSMAQLTHHTSFDASDILAYRKSLKASQDKLGLPNITLNDIVLYAVSRTLKDHPNANAHYLEDQGVMRLFGNVNLGLAVDTPRGLLVPTLPFADSLSLVEICSQAKVLAAEAQSGALSPDKMEGATFTVSNLGNLGVEMFTPVINPPQVAILGVCAIIQRVRQGVDGSLEMFPAMGLSLTYDHRALDGAPASRFLQDLACNLENFTLLLAK